MKKLMYKVVNKLTHGIFLSIGISCPLKYKIDEKTIPEFGKIFCFESLEDAIDWGGRPFTIISGIAENPKRITCVSGNARLDRNFWELYESKKRISVPTLPSPKGTFAADSFTPTKIVSRGH